MGVLLNLTKKLLLAYDPDYTKLLPEEKRDIEAALIDLENGVNIEDGSGINW